jgi:hypothetical protein
MNNVSSTAAIAAIMLGLAVPMLALAVGQPISVDLSGDTVGAEPTAIYSRHTVRRSC